MSRRSVSPRKSDNSGSSRRSNRPNHYKSSSQQSKPKQNSTKVEQNTSNSGSRLLYGAAGFLLGQGLPNSHTNSEQESQLLPKLPVDTKNCEIPYLNMMQCLNSSETNCDESINSYMQCFRSHNISQ